MWRYTVLVVALGITGGACTFTWEQLGSDIDGEAASDLSGHSVSLSSDGTIVAVGAKNNDGSFPFAAYAGHVKVYNFSNGIWDQLGNDIDGEAENDHSGYSVSLSSDGTIVAVGAMQYDGVNGFDSGHVRVHQLNNGNWTKLGSDIDGEAAGDYSGHSVSLSSDGTIVAVGAHKNNGSGTDSGHVRVYNYTNNDWIKLGSDIDGEAANDESGHSVSLSSDGTIVAIGAYLNNVNNNGHIRVYRYTNNDWEKLGSDIDGQTSDRWGWAVALSSNGMILAVSSYGNEKTKIYQYNTTLEEWGQLGNDINAIVYGDITNSVALSDDGTIVAIGATSNDGNGTDSGHTRIFRYEDNQWTQLGIDIDGEAPGDRSGFSVALSSNGETVAIGADGNDGVGEFAGHVRVYRLAATASPTASPTVSPPPNEDSDDNSAQLGIILGSVAGGLVVIGGLVYLLMNWSRLRGGRGKPVANLGNLIF